MKRKLNILAIGAVAIFLCGCQTTGLSLRESNGFNYSNFVYGLYGQPASLSMVKKPIRLPIRLSVAQVGEEAPSAIFLEKIQGRGGLITQVQSIPASGRGSSQFKDAEAEQFAMETTVSKMKMLAKDLGTNYLFIYGGSADYGSKPNAWSLLDMTLIGMYIVPSVDHVAEGKASGALIDVDSGKVLFVVSTQSKMTATTPSFGGYYGGDNPVLPKLRDELVSRIADQLVERLSS